MTTFGVASQFFAELERLAPGVPEDSLTLRQDRLFRPSDLALRGFDFLESFLFPHVRTSGEN